MAVCFRWTVGALGSNVGDRRGHLSFGVKKIGAFLDEMIVSEFLETEHQGHGIQPEYLNAVVVGRSPELPKVLLGYLQDIEQARQRKRPYEGAPRTLDCDLILVGDLVVDSKSLTLPHPRFRERSFVLDPLLSIAPHFVDPVSGSSIQRLRELLVGKSLKSD